MQEISPLQILVPTDFSPCANKALEFAVLLARRTKGKIVILHIYHIPFLPVRGAHFTDTEKGHENREQAEERLRALVQGIGDVSDIAIETKSSPMYGPVEIPEIIKLQSADVIIMGTQKTGGMARWILGANAASVTENAACPVIVIPEEAECLPVRKIGVAYDGLPIEDLTRFDFLLKFASIFDASIDVFHFSNQNVQINEEQWEHVKQFKEYFGLNMDSFYEIPDQSMEEGIHQTLEEKEIDVLTMLPRSKSLLEKLWKGSMTKKMVLRVKTGVMVLPEKFS